MYLNNTKRYKMIKSIFIMVFIILFVVFIWNKSAKEELYVSSCFISESKSVKADYSEYLWLDDEYDYWDELVSDVNLIETTNGVISFNNGENEYFNEYDFYSLPYPPITIKEKGEYFDEYTNVVDRFIEIEFQDGRVYKSSIMKDYKLCMSHYKSELPLFGYTFNSVINSLSYD